MKTNRHLPRRYRRTALPCGALLWACLIGVGCKPPCPETVVPRQALIETHNRNADLIAGLWAVADIEIEIEEEGARRSYRMSDGRLYLLKRPADPFGPQHFLLLGKAIGEKVFALGLDAEAGEYYYWVDPPGGQGRPVARWGRLEQLGRPGWEQPPINPFHLLDLFGVLPWQDTSPDALVVYRALADPCVYDLCFVTPARSHAGWAARRAIWIDRRTETHHPSRIWLFDRQGDALVDAEILRYSAAETDSAAAPLVVSDVRARFVGPQVESAPMKLLSIRVRLTGATTGTEEQPLARPAAFRRRIPAHILEGDARPLGPSGARAVRSAGIPDDTLFERPPQP